MRNTATAILTALMLAACGAPSSEAPPAPEIQAAPNAAEVAAESEALNAFFEAQWQATIARSPMTQTQLGLRGDDYSRWDDPSMENREVELNYRRAMVADMRDQFDFDRLDEQAQLSWRIAEYQLERAEADWPFRYHGYVFDQMYGQQSRIPTFLINQHSISSSEEAEAYISRLEGLPDYLNAHLANAEEAARLGIQPPRFVYDYALSDARNVVTGYPFAESRDVLSPLYADFDGKIDALVESGELDTSSAASLMAHATIALQDHVGPAYENLITVLEAQATLAGTDDGVWRLPDGDAYYAVRLAARTTTDMTADEIHDLGLAETERIHAEMREIMAQISYTGTLNEFFDFMRTDPQFYKEDSAAGREEYLAEARAIIEGMRARLPEVFLRFPEAELEVRAVEAFREQSAGKAFYSRPAADGSRPGYYYANLYNINDMPTYQMEALAFHEGIPGHHMQIAIQQELTGVPSFRRFSGVTAYSEGWGLYSEYFPKEMGFYEDPYSDFGRLAMELWRAARLVVDTGLHDKQWTREQATQWLLENTPNPEGDARKAIDRYIVMPGQATAYKIGMLKILELREQARDALGEDFDIREYHDVFLRNGPVPLSILEDNVEAWIAEVQAR